MLSETDIDLPPIYCPLDPAMNPRARSVEEQARVWLRKSGMCATDAELTAVLGSRSVDFYARFAPDADEHRLLATALWVYWGFAFDDARCDRGPLSTRPDRFASLAGRVQRVVDAPVRDHDRSERFVPALHGIVDMFRTMGTSTQVRRFAAAHRAWLSGVVWRIGNNAQGLTPDLDTYLAMRLLSSGGEPTFAMLELATGAEVPARELESPRVRAVTEMAIMVAALDNDQHSLRRELTESQSGQNIYTVLMADLGLTPAQSVTAAAALRDLVFQNFLRAVERERSGASSELRAYLQGLCDGVRGNAEWGLIVPRQLVPGQGPDSTTGKPALDWADEPTPARYAPPVPPSIAWWWDVHPT